MRSGCVGHQPEKQLRSFVDVSAFVEHFGIKVRWRHRIDSAAASSLLPWSAIDTLVAEGQLSSKHFRIIVNRNNLSPELYTDPATDLVRSASIQSMAEQGATFLLIGVQDMVPAVGELVAEIERLIAARVQANAYLSFGAQSAFDAHCDDHDVLVVQVHGSKRWRGYGAETRFPLKGGSFPDRPVDWEDVLEAGDLLYLPRGEIHAAVPVVRPSVHLTIGISERNGIDFVRTLAEAAEAQELFRRSLSRTDTAAQERDLKQALHALVDAASLDTFLAHDDRQRRLKPAAAFNFLARLRPDTLLASTLLRRIDLHTGDPREIKLVLGGQPVRLPQLARRALDQLTRQERSPLDDLAHALDLDPTDPDLAAALDQLAILALIEICEADRSRHIPTTE